MNEDCVSYIGKESPDFVFFYGNGFKIDKLPEGTRVIYPPKPLPKIENYEEAIEYVLEHPLNQKPFSELLKQGMKVTIAFDDISLPLPPMKRPDLRETAIKSILAKLKKAGINDIHLIAAICLHRKMAKEELKDMLGENIFNEFYPNRLYNHDAEDRENMKFLGTTVHGESVYVNKRAAESDLVIYVNINFVSMDGGHKSFATGLCDYETVKHNHNFNTLMKPESYFDPSNSTLHSILSRQGRLIEQKLKTFHLEMAINNDLFPFPLKFLQKRHYEMNFFDKMAAKITAGLMSILSSNMQRKINSTVRSNYGLVAVYAGDVEQVHQKILEHNFRQYQVDVEGQSDILIGSIPDMSPYSVNSILNPVLFVCLFHGYFFNLYRNKPIVRKGGVLIAFHPLEEEFHKIHHPSYVDFYENILTKTTDTKEIESRYEKEFARNPKYIALYRNSNAYHGVHPFYMWYWGCYGLSHAGKTIVVGAKSERALKILGFEAAKDLDEAMKKAKEFLKNEKPSVTYLRAPPIVMAGVK